MSIQNSNTVQAAQAVRNYGNDVPKVVASPANTQPALGVAVESSQTTAKQLTLQQPSPENLKNAVDVINQALRLSSHSLEFSVDDDTKIQVVKLVDTETGELIRQIPSEETLAISRSIDQFQKGLLLKQEA